jgi:hypothetical protein
MVPVRILWRAGLALLRVLSAPLLMLVAIAAVASMAVTALLAAAAFVMALAALRGAKPSTK